MRLLGIDYGDKKIGLAFGDSDSKLAFPIDIAMNDENIFAKIQSKIDAEDIDKVVVGVPLSQGGHHGPEQLEKTRKFIEELKSKVSVEVVEEDESYTTAESIRLQREEGAEAEDDALAAMLILEAHMNQDG